MPETRPLTPLRVGVLGFGAIGRVVAGTLAAGAVPGAVLSGVATRSTPVETVAHLDLDDLLAASDLIVEAAGQPAVRTLAEPILASGADLLLVSVGALADAQLRGRLRSVRPGRLFYSTGAVGGLDLLAAAGTAAAFTQVRLTTTKQPGPLVQPWMDDATVEALRTATAPLELYRGPAHDVAQRFPASTNVAAAVALACDDWDLEVVVRADPDAPRTRHVIEADGPFGTYRFEVGNVPDTANPATSKVVPQAVLRGVATLAGGGNRLL